MTNAQSNDGSFADYLAQVYIGQRGYSRDIPAEAAELADFCDIVLACSDGYSFRLLCIVDGETHSGACFTLPLERLVEIARRCRRYAGKINFTKLPVQIDIMEIGGKPPDGIDLDRLRQYKRHSLFGKVHVSASHLTPASAKTWSNAGPLTAFFNQRAWRKLMRAPRQDAAHLTPPSVARTPPTPPLVSFALLALLTLAFAAEHIFAIVPGGAMLAPDIKTLIALGGMNADMVLKQGEWYRLLTAAALHGDAFHLLMNAIALYYAGTILERLVGRAWFAALFVLGAVAGSVASLLINPPGIVSVGASGAIMALLAAAYVTSFRLPHGSERTTTQMGLMRILIPALIPLASKAGIDFAAHFGGAVAGVLVGFVLLRRWLPAEPLPRWRRAATAIAVLGVLAFAGSFAQVAAHHQEFTLARHLIPTDRIPKTDHDAIAQAEHLAATYPRDPRARLMLARALMNKNKIDQAENELRSGLAEQEILHTLFAPELDWQLRTVLAAIRIDKGDRGDAKKWAENVCVSAGDIPMRKFLSAQGLCD